MEKTLFVITGAAGTGKTTACHYLCNNYPVTRVITHTTRPPRSGEENGIDYYFETPTSFEKNQYLESVKYSNARYGSSIEGLKRSFAKTDLACIVLDTAGAQSYLKKVKCRVIVLFMTVDDKKINVLGKRMRQRGDTQEQVKKRLSSRDNQRDYQIPNGLKGHVIVVNNDDWKHCRQQLDKILKKVTIS